MQLLSCEAALGDRKIRLRIRKGRPKVQVAYSGPKMLGIAGQLADGVMLKLGHTEPLYNYRMQPFRKAGDAAVGTLMNSTSHASLALSSMRTGGTPSTPRNTLSPAPSNSRPSWANTYPTK